ncbi:sel1 repeat family protein [Pseudoalteromonas luteoviolacea]|uniref:tetratricopeptide repeat protein n=1 Tax=Pseudoalteromonas luteoviolacea TaxID=43657 RepID=UPI001B380722|nr:tetratricopeptide repeat protein [Pseudoalteromonas luteoviolacea]MBQ4812489.1 sel1 repeat family protein [Pseudoalteromonas luteoviolacea]
MRTLIIVILFLTPCVPDSIAATQDLSLKTVEELKSDDSEYSNLVMGMYYEFGYMVEQDFNKAKSHYENSKHPFSFNRLGFLYNSGYGVEIDFRKANQYYNKFKNSDHKAVPEFLLVLEKTHKNNTLSGVLYTNYMQDEGLWSCDFATNRLEDLSSTGNVWALYQLGHTYSSSSSVECKTADNLKAKNYYHLAAEQGHPQSMNNLSVILEALHGNLLANRPLMEESIFWLRKKRPILVSLCHKLI